MTFSVTAQTAFHYCTFRFIITHFVHHVKTSPAVSGSLSSFVGPTRCSPISNYYDAHEPLLDTVLVSQFDEGLCPMATMAVALDRN